MHRRAWDSEREKFVEYITSNLKDATVAICLLSPNYMASKFCNNELVWCCAW